VASSLAGYVPLLLTLLKSDNSVGEFEKRLVECAQQAEREVNSSFFGNRSPTRQECGAEVEVDGCGEPITRAMLLGQRKHVLALQCAREVLAQLWPASFSIEQCYRYYPNARFLETVSQQEEARLIAQGCTRELWRTIKPDIVLHADGNSLRGAHPGLQVSLPRYQPATVDPLWREQRLHRLQPGRTLQGSTGGRGFAHIATEGSNPVRENIPVIRLRTDTGILVARDGVVLCFFMRRSHHEVAPAVWRALQVYLRAIPPQSLKWYVADDGDFSPLDDKGWEVIRKQILERPSGMEWLVELAQDPSEAGGYHFEYDGRKLEEPIFSHDEGATSALALSFPTEYLLEHGPAHLRSLALEIARELPFSFGYASLAFVAPSGSWFPARRELIGFLSRYLGFDFYDLGRTSRVIGTRARGAYWLTFLGQPLLGELGGIEALREKLSLPDVSFQAMEGERLLVSLSEWPEAIDTEKPLHPVQYKLLARLLEPFLYDEHFGWGFLDDDSMRRWLRRLCP